MKSKTIITIIRASIIGISLVFYLLHPEIFSPNNISKIFSTHIVLSLAIYLLIFTLMGFILLPSTVLIVAGALVFPPVYLYIVTLMGILSSSTIVYSMSEYLGFDTFFHAKYPKQLKQLQSALRKKELPIIIGWSFFPLVPTDMICFASEAVGIKLWKCLLGVLIGESVICAIYVFGSSELLQLLRLKM